MEWATEKDDGILITIRVVPRASKAGVRGMMGDAIRIAVNAPAESGKANKELVKRLASLLGVRKSAVSIVSGEKSRTKRVHVAGVSRDEAAGKLV